ncbi:MAG: RNA-binding cell elongation regulator Jag/EloR [Actinomycetota bacterium]
MPESVEVSGRTVEEAAREALRLLEALPEEVDVEVLDEGQRGLFGIGGQQARVRVSVKTPGNVAEPEEPLEDELEPAEPLAGEADEALEPAAVEALDAEADLAEDFVIGLLDALDIDGEVDVDVRGDTVNIDIVGPSMGLLIGRRGATLEALQDLVRMAVQRQTGRRTRLVVDAEGYRVRRQSMLVEQAHKAASRVKASGAPERLDPMSAYERKIVHDALASTSGVVTVSEGEEPYRRVVIQKA